MSPVILSVHFGFIEFGWRDAIDILLAALLLYQLYRLVHKSVTLNILLGFVSVFLVWISARALDLTLLSTLLGQFIAVGAVAMLIVFQPEVRKFLLLLGKRRNWSRPAFWRNQMQQDEASITYIQIVKACTSFSNTNTGALIVIDTDESLEFFIDTGTQLNADISALMLESIFQKNSPLHDGAVIIQGRKIAAAGCTLPVSENEKLKTAYGTRHKAAVGISEHSSCISIVVSEETGALSVAKQGVLNSGLSEEQLMMELVKEDES